MSSTENELTNANVLYAEFNNGLSVQESADVLINNDNDDLTVPTIEKCPFQRNAICLPLDLVFQIHLLSKMNDHRGNDMNMFNEVIQCVKGNALLIGLTSQNCRYYQENNLCRYSPNIIS